MKKYSSLFLILMMTVSLCACGQTKSGTSSAVSGTSAADSGTSDSGTAESDTSESSASDSGTVDSGTAEPAGQTESTPVQTEDGKAKEITIEVTPPDGWNAVEGSVLQVQYMKNTASFMAKDEPFTSSTLDAVVDEALEMYGSSFDNLSVQGDVESITVDNKEARKLIFTCEVSGMNMKYMYVYLFAEGKTYVITFGDLADSFDSLFSDYEAILSNIKFVVQ